MWAAAKAFVGGWGNLAKWGVIAGVLSAVLITYNGHMNRKVEAERERVELAVEAALVDAKNDAIMANATYRANFMKHLEEIEAKVDIRVQESRSEFRRLNKELDDKLSLFDQYDVEALIKADPELVERRMNEETDKLFRDLEQVLD